ncbi:MAG: thiamine diphosphokinase [Clostridia bacterium]|jgi:thiamine pyrophosphokinase|nr:thiamine diphosphokinase [Clostridia bacterium]
MRAAIISSGNISDYDSCKERLKQVQKIICADGGTRHAFHMGIVPDVIIGDLDSTEDRYISYYKEQQVPFVKYSWDKDKTDTHICLEYALESCDEVWLLGATGSRMDHTLANISILRLAADMGKTACIIDENNEIYMTKDAIKLTGKRGDILSLIPLSTKVEGITLRGVYYPLENAVMELGNPYGVSNKFDEETIELEIKSGYMAVIKSKD